MIEIDFDRPENQEALIALYEAIRSHQKFWNGWLSDRLGSMGSFFAGTDDELKAATAFGEALRTIARRASD